MAKISRSYPRNNQNRRRILKQDLLYDFKRSVWWQENGPAGDRRVIRPACGVACGQCHGVTPRGRICLGGRINRTRWRTQCGGRGGRCVTGRCQDCGFPAGAGGCFSGEWDQIWAERSKVFSKILIFLMPMRLWRQLEYVALMFRRRVGTRYTTESHWQKGDTFNVWE